jgi:hypothetical protein
MATDNTPPAVLSALTAQRNFLLALLEDADLMPSSLYRVDMLLSLCERLWQALGYGSMAREVHDRLAERCGELSRRCDDRLCNTRRPAAQRQELVKLMEQLDDMRGRHTNSPAVPG